MKAEAVSTAPSTASSTTRPGVSRDKRDSRWDEHRRVRREQLVQATVAAVGRHGPGVGMEEIAAAAGTSKTVVYRHFADRGELHLAVCAQVAERLLTALREAVGTTARADPDQPDTDRPRQMVAAAIDTYLAFIEADPQLYRFVVHPPVTTATASGPDADPIAGLGELVGEQAAVHVALALQRAGRDPRAAEAWGHGLVGLVRSAADRWLLATHPMPRAELAAHLTDLAWTGLSGVVGSTTQDPPEENR